MPAPRMIVFAGSARRESWNKKLALGAARMAREAGAEVTLLDLADYPLPIMDEDLEAAGGLPENAVKLKELFKDHDGFIACCPEYNSSITPLLKNVIDWLSRPREGEAMLACFRGKVGGLLSASPGPLGGLRGLVTVRSILGNIGVILAPEQHALGLASQVLGADGSIANETQAGRVRGVVEAAVSLAGRVKPG